MGVATGDYKKALDKVSGGPKKNKGGRPPGPSGPNQVTRRNVMWAQKLFQQYSEEALETIVAVMRDPENDAAVRLKASNDILNRSFGTPVNITVQEQINSTADDKPAISLSAISGSSTGDLMALAKALEKYVGDKDNTIDVTPDMPDGYPKK